ncbi:MAG: tetratricopeptide repeat protein, partial [Candidatus Auribacterota bacterium]|nr:tetratricopeptide repeat protein [Candidatus Auribacterota bacterium]
MTPRKYLILAVSVLIILNFIAFSPMLSGNFLNWDDEENVVFHKNIRQFGPDNFIWIFTDFTVGDFKPLVWVNYSFDYTFWGLNPFGYHLGNLLLHTASGVLVFVLFLLIGRRFFTVSGAGLIGPAFLAALFFSLHPLRVESTAWISERKDVLCCFFYLAAVITYVRYTAGRRKVWYLLSFLLSLAAMLSKPMAVTIPLVLILVDMAISRNMRGLRSSVLNRSYLLEKIPFFLLALIVGLIAIYGQTRHQALVPLQLLGVGERILLFCNTLTFYLGRIILPIRISAAYPAATIFSPAPVIGIIAGLLLVTVTIIALSRRRRHYGYVFFWLWFVITILPVSGIFPAGMASVADRFTYIPSVGIAGLVFLGLIYLKKFNCWRPVFFLAAVGIAVIMFLSYRQSENWNNSESLWRDAVDKYPSTPMARAHLGQLLYQRGEDNEAIDHLRASLDSMEGDPMARGDIIFAVKSNLARALGRSGSPDEGAKILEEILEERDDWVTHHSLAGMYGRMGRKEEAIAEYDKVITVRPAFVPALCEQGLLLAQSGLPDRAIEVYLRALTFLPDSPRTRYNLSLAFLDRDEPDRAISLLEQLANEYPDRTRVAEALTIAYQVAGRNEKAEQFSEGFKRVSSTNRDQLP